MLMVVFAALFAGFSSKCLEIVPRLASEKREDLHNQGHAETAPVGQTFRNDLDTEMKDKAKVKGC